MTSAINTSGLNTQYPVAGVNQTSQGFRDNFNNIKQNLDTAASELTDLQSKVILKSALSGANLDNNMNGTIIRNAQTQGFRGTGVNLGTNVSGTVTIDTNAADVYYGTIGSTDITLAFSKWAPAGTLSQVRVILTSSTTYLGTGNIILPAEVNNSRLSIDNIGGANSLTIFPQDYSYPVVDLLFSTVDCGTTVTVTPMNQPRKAQQVETRNLNTLGNVGDVAGSIVYSTQTNQLYVANANYDGTTTIWTAVGNGSGGGASYTIANGTSNVFVNTNSNVTVSVSGNANVLTITGTGTNVAGYITATGNVSASFITANGNLTTFGFFTANQTANFSGNVNLNNTNLSAGTGTLSGGNLSISANAGITGNLTIGANLTVSGRATVTGNLTGGNVITGGFANVGGNLLAGNITANTAILGLTLSTTTGGNLQLNTSTKKVTIQPSLAPAFTANYTLTLPTSSGTFGQVLTTDGTGILSWVNVGGGQVANGSSNISIASGGNISYNVTGNLVAVMSASGISNVNAISANTVSAASLTSNGNILVSGASSSSIISSGGNINLSAIAGQVNIAGNVVVSNSSSTNGYLKAVLIAGTLPNLFTPASSTDAGVPGTITFDSNYLYFCVSSGKWARISVNTPW